LVFAVAGFADELIGVGMTDFVGAVALMAVGLTELADFFAGDAMTILQVMGL
jgi:hypothetical protein